MTIRTNFLRYFAVRAVWNALQPQISAINGQHFNLSQVSNKAASSVDKEKLLRPGQTLATFQRNTLQHCCMMLRKLLNGLAKRTQHLSQHVAVYKPQASGALGRGPKISMEDFE